MKSKTILRILVAGCILAQVGSASTATAAGTTLSIASTSLGKIVVNGKGMTAYFYDLDKAHSGVSACTGNCSKNWPAIISKSAKITAVGIKGKITLLAHTRQIAINGRPIYTFIGDTSKGETNGQGVGGVWYVISANGVELKSTNLGTVQTPAASNPPTISPTLAATPAATPTPTDTATSGTYSNSNY